MVEALISEPETLETAMVNGRKPRPATLPNGTPRIGPTGGFAIKKELAESAIAQLPADQQASMRWLYDYCQMRDLQRGKLDRLLTKENGQFYSYDSIYQALTGRREGVSLAQFCKAIEALRISVEAEPPKRGFVETLMAKKIWGYLQRCRERRRVGFVIGDMTIGKTTAFEELERRDAGVFHFRMPTRGHMSHLLPVMGKKMGMGDRQTVANLRDRIIEHTPRDGILVFDEADQTLRSLRCDLGLATLDFIREIYDARRCAIVLGFDYAGRDALLKGGHTKRLQRLWRRRLPVLQLPLMPYPSDLVLFSESFGLPAAPDRKIKIKVRGANGETIGHEENPAVMQKEVLTKEGLGMWLELLDEATEIAAAQHLPMSWDAVIKTVAIYRHEQTTLFKEEA